MSSSARMDEFAVESYKRAVDAHRRTGYFKDEIVSDPEIPQRKGRSCGGHEDG